VRSTRQRSTASRVSSPSSDRATLCVVTPGAFKPPPAQTPERRAFHIFINYRREDTAGHAGRLYDALAARFGDDHVFIDIDAIDPSEDFTQVVEQSVGSCDVLLALIGRGWTNTVDREGRRRLDKPDDWVRVEIQTALERPDTRVIPTLVQGAEMPSSDELPPPLQKLSHRKAFEIRDSRWRSDVLRLIEDLEGIRSEGA
jgi:TIR domain